MKSKTLLLTLVFFLILGVYTEWTPLVKAIVIINAIVVLMSSSFELWRLIKNVRK